MIMHDRNQISYLGVADVICDNGDCQTVHSFIGSMEEVIASAIKRGWAFYMKDDNQIHFCPDCSKK